MEKTSEMTKSNHANHGLKWHICIFEPPGQTVLGFENPFHGEIVPLIRSYIPLTQLVLCSLGAEPSQLHPPLRGLEGSKCDNPPIISPSFKSISSFLSLFLLPGLWSILCFIPGVGMFLQEHRGTAEPQSWMGTPRTQKTWEQLRPGSGNLGSKQNRMSPAVKLRDPYFSF